MLKYPQNRYNSILKWSFQNSKALFVVKYEAEDYGSL